jgi:hypothetical protein
MEFSGSRGKSRRQLQWQHFKFNVMKIHWRAETDKMENESLVIMKQKKPLQRKSLQRLHFNQSRRLDLNGDLLLQEQEPLGRNLRNEQFNQRPSSGLHPPAL